MFFVTGPHVYARRARLIMSFSLPFCSLERRSSVYRVVHGFLFILYNERKNHRARVTGQTLFFFFRYATVRYGFKEANFKVNIVCCCRDLI